MLHLTLQQLRLFAAVARNKSFTRAAKEVHLTQPAVSIQVKRLEEQVGQPLFEQVGKQLHLTRAGKILLEGGLEILGRVETLDYQLAELVGDIAGPLNLGVVTTAKYFLPRYLGDFLRLHPKVLPQLKVTNRDQVVKRMEDNLDDLYIIGTLPEDQSRMVVTPFLDDDLVVFAAPGHPLAKEKLIPLERLSREQWLARESGSGIRHAVERHLAQYGVELTPYMELGSGEAIKQGVMAGIGFGILSNISVRMEVEVGRLVILDVDRMPIHRLWYAVHPEGKKLSLTARKFLDFLVKNGSRDIEPSE